MNRWTQRLVSAGVAALLTALTGQAQMTPQMQELAHALLRLEYALKERPLAPEPLAAASQAFDRATFAFFAGRNREVLQTLDSLVAHLEPDPEARARQADAAATALAAMPGKRRVLEGDHPSIPYRLHGPAKGGAGPFPVIVALHGAGGNEHMFLEAYGAGRLKDLAEQQGFVVISPATAALARSPAALKGLLDAAAEEYPIDRGRVGVVGHSMGAGAAWALAEHWRENLVGVACIAGACPGRSGGPGAADPAALPPLLLIAGETDPLAPPSRLAAAAAQGRERGVAVDYRVIPGLGHTLVVGAVLDDVVAWLLARPERERQGSGRQLSGRNAVSSSRWMTTPETTAAAIT